MTKPEGAGEENMPAGGLATIAALALRCEAERNIAGGIRSNSRLS
jgi:hypothetical protein